MSFQDFVDLDIYNIIFSNINNLFLSDQFSIIIFQRINVKQTCPDTLISPIKQVANLSSCENRVKQIFLLTDGGVSNADEVVRVASKAVKPYVNENGETFPNFYHNRIFTLAIGHRASQSLCRELAMKSHGTTEACDETNFAENSGPVSFYPKF